MSDTDQAASDHIRAARALLKATLEQFKAMHPDEYGAVALAARQGAAFQIRTCLSMAGLMSTSIDLVLPDGESRQFFRTEHVPVVNGQPDK